MRVMWNRWFRRHIWQTRWKVRWNVVSDSSVRHTWECPRCNRDVTVSPAYYAGSGTPVCNVCDVDMSYIKTECAT
jgi:transcription elongation factor Elf1